MTAVLFDLDGTLIDSLEDIAGALNDTLAELGLPTHAIDDVRKLVGYGAAELVRGALPDDRRDPAAEAEVLARYRARYRAHLVVRTRPYDGVEAMLEALEADGVPKAIVTNKPHDATLEITQRLLGRFRWDAVLGQQPGVPHKPDPSGALEIARRLGVDPGACFFVGDSDTDMRTSTNAGMIAVGCLWGFRGREELVRCGARHLVAHPRELLPLVTPRS
jgi:phosphoglycolate phosphatase